MPTYIMLNKLTPEGVKSLKNDPKRILEVNRELEHFGVKITHQWGTLGEYNFVTVVDAPDTISLARMALEMGSRGTITSQTLIALSAEEIIENL